MLGLCPFPLSTRMRFSSDSGIPSRRGPASASCVRRSRCHQDTGSLFSSPRFALSVMPREVAVLTAATNEHPPFSFLRLSAGTQWHQATATRP